MRGFTKHCHPKGERKIVMEKFPFLKDTTQRDKTSPFVQWANNYSLLWKGKTEKTPKRKNFAFQDILLHIFRTRYPFDLRIKSLQYLKRDFLEKKKGIHAARRQGIRVAHYID